MRTRRGSSYWTSEMVGMLNQFQAGDIVTSVIVGGGEFIGVVQDVNPRTNKVMVAWGGGVPVQHDPDEIQLSLHQTESVKVKMASRRGLVALSEEEAEKDPQFVGDPKTHGIDKPVGGGFSIMQQLQKKLHEESYEEAGANPMVAGRRMRNSEMVSDQEDGPLRSRRAMYWCGPDRTYRLTRNEQTNDGAVCPKCKGEMERMPYTKKERMYRCSECGFMVSTGKLTTRRVEVEVEPDGTVEVEIASLKSRRSAAVAA